MPSLSFLLSEKDRLEALARYEILDTLSEAEFDDITWLASHLCGAPIAFISLIDANRQWFKSSRGLAEKERPRDLSFCTHAIQGDGILEVPNALEDARFRDNPLVIGASGICFYASAPLRTPDGHNIGTLGVADIQPRQLTDPQREGLVRLSRQVIRLLESRRAQRELERISLDEKKSLQEKERWAATLLSNLDGMVFRSTGIDEVVFEYVSSGSRELLGLEPEELISQRIKYVDLIHPEDKPRVLAHRAAMIRARQPYETEYRIVLPTQEVKCIWVRARGVFSTDDIFEGLEGILTDITARKNIEANFLRTERLESIGTLAGGIAHDLNNLLSPIMIGVDLLKHFGLTGTSLKVVEDIERSTRRGARLVQQVLSFARGEEGARVSVHIGDVMNEVASIVKSSFPKNIELETRVSGDLWLIQGDPTQITQVLLNLCVNARDALPRGGRISITARNTLVDANVASVAQRKIPAGRYVCVRVGDNGIGISKENLSRIFEPFFTTKELGKGTGLGLAAVLGIVRAHGGLVDVESGINRGTTFEILLPALATDPALPSDAMAEEAHPAGHGEWILVIDDEPAILSITEKTLNAYGYKVFTAEDGEKAVEVFRTHQDRIAGVITDMMMPRLDGPATIAALQRIQPDVRLIGATGMDANEQLARSAELGVKHFMAKPYSTATLLKTLKNLLAR